MFIEDRSQERSDVEHLKGDISALREANAVLVDTLTRTGLTAARTRQAASRIRADAKHLRGELFRVRLPREPTSGALARRLVEEHLPADFAERIADAKTVVTELVNNAIVHGQGAIELRVSTRHGRVRIDVKDEGKDASIRSRVADAPHGLDIVDALSLAWGAREGRTHVWAELDGHGLDEHPTLPGDPTANPPT